MKPKLIEEYIGFAIKNGFTDLPAKKFDVEEFTIEWYEYPVWVPCMSSL